MELKARTTDVKVKVQMARVGEACPDHSILLPGGLKAGCRLVEGAVRSLHGQTGLQQLILDNCHCLAVCEIICMAWTGQTLYLECLFHFLKIPSDVRLAV